MEKYYLITGASSGIGYKTAEHLAENEANVIVVARTESSLRELEDKYPEQIKALALDITDENSVNEIKKHLSSKGIKLDGIVHNAGLLIAKPFAELTNEDWKNQIDVNLLAPVSVTRNLLGHLNENAHILNISSMGGFMGSSKFPGLSAYSASKGALSILTECLTVELADQNIKCNCLCLGAVQTEMLETAFPGMQAPVSADDMGSYVADFLMNGHKFYNGKILPVALADPA